MNSSSMCPLLTLALALNSPAARYCPRGSVPWSTPLARIHSTHPRCPSPPMMDSPEPNLNIRQDEGPVSYPSRLALGIHENLMTMLSIAKYLGAVRTRLLARST